MLPCCQRSDQNRNVTHGFSKEMKFIQILPGLWKKTVDLLGLYLPNILKHMAGFSWVKTVDRQEHCQSFVDGGGLWALCILLAEEAPRQLGWPRMASKKDLLPHLSDEY